MKRRTPADAANAGLARHALQQEAMLKLLGYNLAQASIPTNRVSGNASHRSG